MLDFFEAVLMAETSAENAYAKFDDMNARITGDLRKITKLVQDYRQNREDEKGKGFAISSFHPAVYKAFKISLRNRVK